MKIEITLDDNRKAENSYGFAQAIAFMIREMPGRKLSDQDLFEAYQVAGARFGPEMGHYFVLMNHRTAEKMAQIRDRKGSNKNQKKTAKGGTSGPRGTTKGGTSGPSGAKGNIKPHQQKKEKPFVKGARQDKIQK